jgi:hypothetical protein
MFLTLVMPLEITHSCSSAGGEFEWWDIEELWRIGRGGMDLVNHEFNFHLPPDLIHSQKVT